MLTVKGIMDKVGGRVAENTSVGPTPIEASAQELVRRGERAQGLFEAINSASGPHAFTGGGLGQV